MDSQTINLLATTAVGFLAPYLAKAGEAAAKTIGEDIYHLLNAYFSKKPAAQESLTDLKKAPDDPDYQASLRVQLKKLLEKDKTLARQLQNVLKRAEKTEAGATIIKQVAGDNATQIGQVGGNVSIRKD